MDSLGSLLSGKVAVITGGGSGIGRGIGIYFASLGARIAIGELDLAAGEDVVREIDKSCGAGTAMAVKVDVTVADEVNALVDAAAKRFGTVGILVNSAGAGTLSTVVDMIEEEWDLVMDVNVKGTFLATRSFAAYLIAHGKKGKIINLSSINEVVPLAGMAHYCASKGAVFAFTRATALELAPYGIHVNAIAPGTIDTPLMEEPLLVPEVRAMLIKQIPFGRFGRPLDVAKAAAFLASPLSDWVTGHSLEVDGGMHLVGEESYLWAIERCMGHSAAVPKVPVCWPPDPEATWPAGGALGDDDPGAKKQVAGEKK